MVVYPVGGFTAYVVISIIWLFVGGFLVGIFPLWEARKGIWHVSNLSLATLVQLNRYNSADSGSDLYIYRCRYQGNEETGIDSCRLQTVLSVFGAGYVGGTRSGPFVYCLALDG